MSEESGPNHLVEEQRRTAQTERARLATLIESMRDGVLVVDADGRTVIRNTAFARLVEHPGRGADGLPFNPDALRKRVARGEDFVLPFVLVTRDGHRWFEAYARPVPAEMGIGGGGVLIVHDNTDVSLRQLQDEFVAIVAHELRTPLTAMRGYLQLLARRADDHERLLPLIRREADRLQEMVDELFEVVRMERGRLTVERVRQPIGEIVRDTIEIAQGLTDVSRIRYTAPEQDVDVWVDRGRIQQVVLNLLMNAIVHAPDAGDIEVRLRRLRQRVELEVEDHGPGIAPDDQLALFEPFVQSGRGRRRHGLGLGLYIARQIVEAHQGTLDVDSAVGEGTTFTVRLPVTAPVGPERDGRSPAGRSPDRRDGTAAAASGGAAGPAASAPRTDVKGPADGPTAPLPVAAARGGRRRKAG